MMMDAYRDELTRGPHYLQATIFSIADACRLLRVSTRLLSTTCYSRTIAAQHRKGIGYESEQGSLRRQLRHLRTDHQHGQNATCGGTAHSLLRGCGIIWACSFDD
nr:unnamed protein product [Spirometra erinaceieuropaei]